MVSWVMDMLRWVFSKKNVTEACLVVTLRAEAPPTESHRSWQRKLTRFGLDENR